MTTRIAPWLAGVAALALPLWTGGCGGKGEATARGPAAAEAAAGLPAALFAPIAEQPVGVAAARSMAADGERIVLRGMIGGRVDPFVEQRAIVLLIDESLPLCQGCCKTPWDLCCERPEAVRDHSVTVQVADADGQPLRLSLRGHGGLEPMATVIASGTVQRPADGIFVVNADRLNVVPRGAAAACPSGSGCPH